MRKGKTCSFCCKLHDTLFNMKMRSYNIYTIGTTYTGARGLRFIDDYDLKLRGKYSSLAAMLIRPVITIFYIDFFQQLWLENAQIGRQLTFPYL